MPEADHHIIFARETDDPNEYVEVLLQRAWVLEKADGVHIFEFIPPR